jgi:outer membrane protein assembly factor BamE
MQMSSFYTDRVPAIIGSFCIVIATGLAGCASKNPLMEEPVTAGASAAAPAPRSASLAQANPAPSAAVAGVQTSRKRRFLGIFSPYRVDVQQGNFVSREMVAQLKESMKNKQGMTPDQVRFVMGTPLLTDVFHQDRWDYPFRLEKANGEIITSRVTVFFKDNRLVNVEGGDLPTEKDYLSLIAGRPGVAPAAPATTPAAPPPTNK